MKKLFLLSLSFLSLITLAADQKISQLPLGAASSANVNDAVPYYDYATASTKRMKLSDLIHLPWITLNALLPNQVGHNGECLQTNGTTTAWATCGSGGGGTWGTITGTLSSQVDLQNALNAKQSISARNAVNGYAGLGADGRMSFAQLPAALGSAFTLKGNWNANTNVPPLASGSGSLGDYYVVGTGGGTNLDGKSTWAAGDAAYFDGSAWQRIVASNTVLSVNGLTGAVNLTSTEVTEGSNLYHTSARARSAAVLNTLGGTETDQAPSVASVKLALADKQDALGFTAENVANKSTDTNLGTSDTLYPTQNAVKEYVDSHSSGTAITSLTGEVTATGPGEASATLSNSAVIGKVLTGYTAGAGVVAATDSIIHAIQKLDGNIDTDGTLSGNSDTRYPSQKAVKTYVDAKPSGDGAKNYTTNPSALFDATTGVTATDVTVTRYTTVPDYTIDGKTSFLLESSTDGGSVCWAATVPASATGDGMWGAQYLGDGTHWDLQLRDASDNVLAHLGSESTGTYPLTNSSTWTPYTVGQSLANRPLAVGQKVCAVHLGTGTDSLYVGRVTIAEATNLFSVANPARRHGAIRYAGAANCNPSTETMGSWQTIGPDTDCGTAQTFDNAITPATGTLALPLTNMGPGLYKIKLRAPNIYADNSGANGTTVCNWSFSDGTSQKGAVTTFIGRDNTSWIANDHSVNQIEAEFIYTDSPGNKTFTLQAFGSNSGSTTSPRCAVNILDSGNSELVFEAYYYPTGSQLAAQVDHEYGWTPYTPEFTGMGTVSGVNCRHRRMKENLEVDCNFTTGEVTATEARVSFPNSLVSSSALPTLSLAGNMAIYTTGPWTFYTLREPSVSYFTFGYQSASTNGLMKSNGNGVFGNNQTTSFRASVPIQGWSALPSPVLQNQVSTSATGGVRVESANIAAPSGGVCVVTETSGDWINGNATSDATGRCAISFNPGIVSGTPTCTVTASRSYDDYAAAYGFAYNASSSGIKVQMLSGTTLTDEDFNIICVCPR